MPYSLSCKLCEAAYLEREMSKWVKLPSQLELEQPSDVCLHGPELPESPQTCSESSKSEPSTSPPSEFQSTSPPSDSQSPSPSDSQSPSPPSDSQSTSTSSSSPSPPLPFKSSPVVEESLWPQMPQDSPFSGFDFIDSDDEEPHFGAAPEPVSMLWKITTDKHLPSVTYEGFREINSNEVIIANMSGNKAPFLFNSVEYRPQGSSVWSSPSSSSHSSMPSTPSSNFLDVLELHDIDFDSNGSQGDVPISPLRGLHMDMDSQESTLGSPGSSLDIGFSSNELEIDMQTQLPVLRSSEISLDQQEGSLLLTNVPNNSGVTITVPQQHIPLPGTQSSWSPSTSRDIHPDVILASLPVTTKQRGSKIGPIRTEKTPTLERARLSCSPRSVVTNLQTASTEVIESASMSPLTGRKSTSAHIGRSGKKVIPYNKRDEDYILNATAQGLDVKSSKGVYPCPFSDCNKTFTRKNDVGRHVKSSAAHKRSADRSSRCQMCGESLSRPDARRRHEAKIACGKRTKRAESYLHPTTGEEIYDVSDDEY